MTPAVDADPLVEAVEAAEDDALGGLGPRWRTWAALVAWVESVTTHHEWIEAFPGAPIDVAVVRRSRSAHYAAAHAPSATIAIPDGAWSPAVVIHELTHLACPTEPPHGREFIAAELVLVRRFLGVEAWAAYRQALDRVGLAM